MPKLKQIKFNSFTQFQTLIIKQKIILKINFKKKEAKPDY